MRTFLSFLALFALLALSPAPAAVAPRPDKELDEGAAVIVTGKVTDLTPTRNATGTVEIKIEVASVSKGDIKKGATLHLISWSSAFRTGNENINGPQGLDPLPKKGDTVKAWLTVLPDRSTGIFYVPLLPNGVQTVPVSQDGAKKKE